MAKVRKEQGNWIKFLGTAGARFVVIRQLRASGGIWISYNGTNILIDPGPGSIVRCATSKPKLDPGKLDGIILTHRHLDHSSDINVMIEAITDGGFKKRGVLFAPADALELEPVVWKHTRGLLEKIEFLKENNSYSIGEIKFSVPKRQIHPVETYGLKFNFDNQSVSFITDTHYYPQIEDYYKADIVIIYVVFYEPRMGVDHLSLPDAETIIEKMKPRLSILTHFGMTMLKEKPHLIAEVLTNKLNTEVIAAYDGMRLDI